jgi:hypothetical protein
VTIPWWIQLPAWIAVVAVVYLLESAVRALRRIGSELDQNNEWLRDIARALREGRQ